MQKNILLHKVVLHIPQQAWINDKLIDIDITEAIKELLTELEDAGIVSLYQTQVTGYYNGRSYPEMLLTIFGTEETTVATEIFVKWNKEYGNILQQEAFAYEQDGELFVYRSEECD